MSLKTVNLCENKCIVRGIENKKETDTVHIHSNVQQLIKKYYKCFDENSDLLCSLDIEMHIELTSAIPINYKPYRLSLFEREKVREIVKDLLEKEIIKPTISPYSSPILLLQKKTGDYRLVVDYRKLNEITAKDRFPLPLIEDQLERLMDNQVFTTLDLKSGYHQIRLAKDSQKYTAFITPDGHYHYTRIPFGLCNAPAVFQRAINLALGQLIHHFALVYLDDILIVSRTEQEGIERLEEVLKALFEAGLTLNLSKCEFLKTSVEYLGTRICNGLMTPSDKKLRAVREFTQPTNVHQVRQFYGLASYFRKYIRDFAVKAKPLSDLLRKKSEWSWKVEHQQAFNVLKQEITQPPVLAIFNPNLETQVHTDASKHGYGGVLMQKQKDESWKPIAYMSRRTTDAETRYHSFELETLAVYEAVSKQFRNFLYGRHFTIVTDCNAMRLTWLKRDLNPRIGRWWLAMQDFDFTVIHRPGQQMNHVDALSRNPVTVNKIRHDDWVAGIQHQDEDIQLLRQQIKDGEVEGYTESEEKVCKVVDGKPKILIPRDVRWRVVKMFHDENGHPGWQRTLHAIKDTYWFNEMNKFVKKYVSNCISCMVSKKPTGRRRGVLHPIEKVEEPFHTLHIDHLGPFCKTETGCTQILTVIDAFTKFIWLEAVPNTSSIWVCQKLEQLIKLVHSPKRVISDRGKAFDCNEFKKFCKKYNIRHVKNAIASPRSNGQVERQNRTVLEALTASIDGRHDEWDKHLIEIQRGINSTLNGTTGFAPSELLYGFRPNMTNEVRLMENEINLKEKRAQAKLRCDLAAQKMKARYDRNRLPANRYKSGDVVLVEKTVLVKGLTSGKLVPKYIGPVKIVDVLGNDRYRVASFSKDKRRFKGVVASDRLKLFRPQVVDI